MNDANLLWGVDLGGTKVEIAVLDKNHHILFRKRYPTEQHRGYAHILNQIIRLIDEAKHVTGSVPEKIGVGIPGTIDVDSKLIKNANTQALNGKRFDTDLSQLIQCQVNVANDANCFTLAETLMGAVADNHPDASVIVGLILGTGVGSGIVVNGKIINGRHGIAGEWGHNPLLSSSQDCYCGKSNCIETAISGPATEAYYEQLTGQYLPLKTIAQRAERGDQACLKTLHRWLEHFGMALAPVINILDPDVIVVGGGLGNMDIIYKESKSYIAKHVFNPVLQTAIIKPKLGDSAGVIGAAMIARSY